MKTRDERDGTIRSMPSQPKGPSTRLYKGDLLAGASAAFVLIPQSLAYAQLAGMPPYRGLYVAALAPIAAAFLASSPYLGTGPTAVTSLLTFGALAAIAVPGSPTYVASAALLALLAGTIRVVLGVIRAGSIAYLLSQPVITGFTTGAAVVIVASQIPDLLDVEVTSDNPFIGAYQAIVHPEAWRIEALLIGLAVIAIMLGGRRIHRLFPGVLLAVIAATVYSSAVGYTGATVGQIAGGLPPFSLDMPWESSFVLLLPAVVIAVVGFSEPASIARRYATIERQRWDPNRELVSQGMANIAAAIGGGFPAGGSFSRSALVRDAGARTRWAGGITGLVVLAMLPFMNVLSALPVAALAGGIIIAVRELIDPRPFREYYSYARFQFYVAMGTLVATVVLAPHVERGVLLGIAMAIVAHLVREMRLSIRAWVEDGTLNLAPKGVLFFASAPGLQESFSELLSQHREAHRLILHLGGLGRVDLTGALALRAFIESATEAGLEVEMVDIPPAAQKIIARVVMGATNGPRSSAPEGRDDGPGSGPQPGLRT